MPEDKADLILEAVTRLERDVASVKSEVASVKSEVASVKDEVASIKSEVASVKSTQDEMLGAFRENWSHMADLYREVRDDLKAVEQWSEKKFGDVLSAIAALRSSIESQDFRNDELARRVHRLEAGDKPPV